ncbi:class A beta-lactamase [Actinomadura craniellae]|uniref:Class A beta-lactamase n=1 Tax=Actinomadura craniellae TaxID=2231787 RepID=A0A365HC20_9ACTN|nr:class A beta-lactamase [Actinomadura craniellae]RAY16562.1 class A beta-lactamase [Actinomadura craniellae]
MFVVSACGGGPAATGEHATRPETGTAGAPTLRGAVDVRAELRRLEASFQGRIGAFALDTGTGRTVGHREHERFPGNSTFKAILCGAILARARTADPGLLERTLRWTKDDLVAHSPITGLRKNVEGGMTAAQLCHATITTSDNTAANVLLEQIGGPPGMTRYYRSLGDPAGRLDRWETELNVWRPGERRDTITPALMARDLHRLTLGPALVPQDRQRLVGWLRAATTGAARIRAGLPAGWTVGDKTGTGGGAHPTASDIAIAWPPSGAPVVIAIYTYRTAPGGTVDDRVLARTASLLARGLGRIS